MRLIDNWKRAWKLHSVQLNALVAALSAVFLALPREDQLALIGFHPIDGQTATAALVIIVTVLQTLVRLMAQPELHEKE